MRAVEFVRQILDLIDQFDAEPEEQERYTQDDEHARFDQIADILQTKDVSMPCANTPNEVVADIDSVTTLAGGGVNGPKHPADIRVKDPTDYPVR